MCDTYQEECAVDAGFAELEIEGDNATVMKSLASLPVIKPRLGNIYEDIRVLASGCRSVFSLGQTSCKPCSPLLRSVC